MKLTQERLKERLHYNPDTGCFTWLKGRCGKFPNGEEAGYLTQKGYHRIGIDGEYYQSHRLAFLYMTGEIPKFCDHINRIKDDNRWCNLRPATHLDNMRNIKTRKNNTTGYPGVGYHNPSGKFIARINLDGKLRHIGTFDCKHHAFCEYVLAARKNFGEFSPV